jgi:hypothetical protein
MKNWLQHGEHSPRPPLPGRLVGLAIGVLLLSLATYVALDVVLALIPVVVPLIVLFGIYSVIFRGRHK